VLKIDAEGNDVRVLKGLDLEGPYRPRLIMCEFDGGKVAMGGHTYEDATSLLAQNGYALLVSEWAPVARYGSDHHWRRARWFPHDLEDPMSHGNVIAIDKGRGKPEDYESLIANWEEEMAATYGTPSTR
jgi:hypothetical protein